MKSLLLFSCFLLFSANFYGQRLYGTISDAETDQPIAGVNVFIKSLKKGVTSKNDGVFYFEQADGLKKEDTILFNIVGYKTRTLTLEEYESQNNKIKLSEEQFNSSKLLKSSGRIISIGSTNKNSE